jgi:exopolysaccharide biosynthesis polyprenyl glycosylphosphotransferase
MIKCTAIEKRLMLRRSTNQIILSISLDVIGIILAAWLAMDLRVRLGLGRELPYVMWGGIFILEIFLIYPAVFFLLSVYDPDRLGSELDETRLVANACLLSALALAGLVYFTERGISRLLLVYFYILHFVIVIGWRMLYSVITRRGGSKVRSTRRILLVGSGEMARLAVERLERFSWMGVKVVGMLDDDGNSRDHPLQLPLLGHLKESANIVREQRIHDVLIALPSEAKSEIQFLVDSLVDQPCTIWLAPDYLRLLVYGSRISDLGGVPLISLKAPGLTGYQRVIKRIFDLVLGSITLMLSLPLMCLIALVIRLDSPGPVLLRQQRVGENRHLFWMYKFRTMVRDAETRFTEVVQQDENGNVMYKSPHDPRITRIGRLLRRTSLDELPQLFNVLKGEMSLVGPRPELVALVECYETWQQKRFAVPQGITGWWQINGRSDRPMHLHTEYDLYYVQNYSILLDIQILWMTIWVVLRQEGAF